LLEAAEGRLRDDAGSAFDAASFLDGLISNGPIPAATALTARHGEAFVSSLLAGLCEGRSRTEN
jgi:hypothetical protein